MSLQDRLLMIAKMVLDLSVLMIAYGLAFWLRFEGAIPPEMSGILLLSLPCALLTKCVCFAAFEVPRLPWRCVSLVEVKRITLALSAASAVLVAIRLVAAAFKDWVPALTFLQAPLGVLAIDFALSLLGIVGVRAGYRALIEWRDFRRRNVARTKKTRTLLIGTGRTGVLVAKELVHRPDYGFEPLGFIGENPSKLGMVFHGLPVVGLVDNIETIIRTYGAEQILITASDIAPEMLRNLMRAGEKYGVRFKIVPEAGERAGDVINLARVRDVSIEDLLRRDVIRLKGEGVNEMIRDQTVLVTGAGGSIGSEICRAVCRHRPKRLILVEQAENNLFLIHRELAQAFPDLDLMAMVADICDGGRVSHILGTLKPDVLFHAAAHKHVPLMEWNPGEAVKNNVLGTRDLADLAHAHGVGRFVMISTDKAVNPTSIMGVAKRTAELYIQALSQRSPTRFVTVRFGNVLGSSGSVIPIFQDQILKGGPVTVTHPEMRRYFMTIPEACNLVLEAASLGEGGEIFILDMGEPVKIVDLAHDLIRLSGFTPDVDIKVQFSGIRPGEKLFEELSLADEQAERTRHPRIFIGKLRAHDWDAVQRQIEELGAIAGCGDPSRIRAKFKEIVPEYQDPGCPLPPTTSAGRLGRDVGTDRRTPIVSGKALKAGTLPKEG